MQESIEASLVRIHTPDGHVVGAGFLVGERYILTCAHVVAGALGLVDDTSEKPEALVSLDVPRVAPGQMLTARVVLWRSPRADGGDDIAGLELLDVPPHGAQAAPLAQVEDLWDHSFRAFGFPRGQDSGVWATGRLLGRQLNDWVQIEDVKETGFAVEPGFSGTPVWDPKVEGVVGMVVAAEKRMNLKTAFAIPVDVLARSWPLLESLIHPFVFLCYARADSELVTRLKTDLLGQGVHVWIDREGLQPGTLDWEEALRTAIRAARAVLLIASPHARSSRYIRDELRIAEMYQRSVYPLWIAGTQWMNAVPLGWGGVQYLDARESRYEKAIPELAELLDKAASTPLKAPGIDFEARNPYKGLRAFTGDDAHDFFGRDRLIYELIATLEGALASEEKNEPCTRLLAVVGASGSGKSSVVMAGLLPRLQEGRLPGSEKWVYLDPIVPGVRPIETLTLALSEHLPDTSLKAIREDLEDDTARGLHLLATKLTKRPGNKVVLLVDQFEELFTQTHSEDERRHFLDLLVTAITEPHGPVTVLLTLRADFYDRPLAYPALGQLIPSHQMVVLPMAIPELREVIEKPAALPDVRLTFEGDLMGDLLFEVQGQVGALPLLQFTLDQLFQRRSGSQLTLSAYREMGGVKGALTKQAEETYAALPSDEHRKLARALFVRLIDPGASEQDTTRRRAALAEFSLADATQTRMLHEVIDDFIMARLLTTNEIGGTTIVEVSHEALIREWKRLADWLQDARDDILFQHSLSEDVEEWKRRKRPRDRLYRGTHLKEAQTWAKRNRPSEQEIAFLRTSTAQRILSLVSFIVVVFLLFSSMAIAGWKLFLQPKPTLVTTLLDSDNVAGSLRWCIENAPSGSTITFDQSLWENTVTLTGNLSIANKSLTIRGPSAGTLIISTSTHQISVSSDASVQIFDLNFNGSKANTVSLLSNSGTLTLTNSTVSGNSADSDGGGMYNAGTLKLSHSTVSGNTALNGVGGGIFNKGTLTLSNNSIVSENTAVGSSGNGLGGGIYNYGTLTLNNSTISGNTVRSSVVQGGGIDNDGKLIVTHSIISKNMAISGSNEAYGGGIANFNTGILTVSSSTFKYNSASGSKRGQGGGIDNSGKLTVTQSIFSNNSASSNSFTGSGGGISNSSKGTVMVTTSTFLANSVSGKQGGQGGGIYNDGKLTVVNNTLSNNVVSGSRSYGGGIFSLGFKGSSTIIRFCTIYGNNSNAGGGIWVDSTGTSHMTISSSVIAANNAQDISGLLISGGYNLLQNFAGATGLNATTDKHVTLADLKIDPTLSNNGGPTKTFALLPGSSAIDVIPMQVCSIRINDAFGDALTIVTDQRGDSRPDGSEDTCDIGAYESAF
jgi:TIR domain/Trypsin-like peptidase domain